MPEVFAALHQDALKDQRTARKKAKRDLLAITWDYKSKSHVKQVEKLGDRIRSGIENLIDVGAEKDVVFDELVDLVTKITPELYEACRKSILDLENSLEDATIDGYTYIIAELEDLSTNFDATEKPLPRGPSQVEPGFAAAAHSEKGGGGKKMGGATEFRGKCFECNKVGHRASECPVRVAKNKLQNKAGGKREQCGSCGLRGHSKSACQAKSLLQKHGASLVAFVNSKNSKKEETASTNEASTTTTPKGLPEDMLTAAHLFCKSK